MRAVRELPVDPTPVVEHEVDRMEFRLGRRGRFERKGRRGSFVLMTQRRRLDHYLAEQAAAAGADFRDGVKVSLDQIDAEVIVGADGANGTTAKTLGLGGPIVHGVAFEGNAPYDDRYRGLALIELGSIPGGYGWIFPKGDHVNVGVGGWESEGPRLRDHLAALCCAPRDRRRLARERARAPAAAPPRRVRPRAGQGAARRRRLRARRPADRRRDVRGLRQRAACGRGDARRSGGARGDGRAVHGTAAEGRSAHSPAHRGQQRSRSTASRARSSRSHGCRSSGRSSSGSFAATSRRRTRRGASRARR